MRNANVKFNYRDGKGFDAAWVYAQRLIYFGFKFSGMHPKGGNVYHHDELDLDVCVYVS